MSNVTIQQVSSGPTPASGSTVDVTVTIPSLTNGYIEVEVGIMSGAGLVQTNSVVLDPSGVNVSIPNTARNQHNGGQFGTVEKFGIKAPPAVSAVPLRLTFSGGVIYSVNILVCENVDQTTPYVAATNTQGTAGNASASSAASVAGDLVTAMTMFESFQNITIGGGETQIGLRNNAVGSYSEASSYKLASGTTTSMTKSFASNADWVEVTGTIKQLGGGGGGVVIVGKVTQSGAAIDPEWDYANTITVASASPGNPTIAVPVPKTITNKLEVLPVDVSEFPGVRAKGLRGAIPGFPRRIIMNRAQSAQSIQEEDNNFLSFFGARVNHPSHGTIPVPPPPNVAPKTGFIGVGTWRGV